jgi:hypothetical protein
MQNSLIELLQGQLSDQMLDSLSDQIGGARREQTSVAAKGIISSLIGGMTRNAQSEEGRQSLNNALERDNHDDILEDALGFLTRQRQPSNPKALNGEGIVNHVFQGQQGGVMDMVSRLSGLDTGKTGNLMSMLAPLVMGALGKTKKQQGLDAGGIFSLLQNTTQQQQQESPQNSLLNTLLDSDNDGSIMDDVAGMGMKLLGNLFKK